MKRMMRLLLIKKNKGKGTEDTPEGDEGGPEGFDPKTVQNPKKEAEELGDLDEKEKGLQAKLQDLGKKLDGDTTTEELDTIIKEMQELSTQLKEVEENVQKKEALEKEHDRRVAVVGKEWKDALEKSGLPENERAFITMELGGDGDDLVLTMREELNNEAAVKALTAMGFKVADGTLRKEDASPKLFSEEGQEKLQKICEMAAIPLKLEKKEGAEGEALPPGAAENIAELGLSKHEDGNYAREGHDGGYIVQKDGSIFYTGGPGPGGKTSSQTYANGKWDKERNKRLV